MDGYCRLDEIFKNERCTDWERFMPTNAVTWNKEINPETKVLWLSESGIGLDVIEQKKGTFVHESLGLRIAMTRGGDILFVEMKWQTTTTHRHKQKSHQRIEMISARVTPATPDDLLGVLEQYPGTGREIISNLCELFKITVRQKQKRLDSLVHTRDKLWAVYERI